MTARMKIQRMLLLPLALAVFAVPGVATTLSPGDTDIGLDSFATVGGTVLANISPGIFTAKTFLGTTTATGTYTEEVVRGSDNALCAGCLDFVISFSNNASSKDPVTQLSTLDFSSLASLPTKLIDVGKTGPGTAPITSSWTAAADEIVFNYSSLGVKPGQMGVKIQIETHATAFTAGDISLLAGGTADVAGFAPAPAPVPEPASSVLLLVVLGAAGLLVGKRAVTA